MNKRCLVVMFLAVLCVFSSCAQEEAGCAHEWTDVSCETAKVCALCGEVAEEALGHDFADATCENPKTCTRCELTDGEALGHSFTVATCSAPETCGNCGLTQGDALSHDYSKWEIAGEDMTRQCELCQLSETIPVDRELYLQDRMVGNWEWIYDMWLLDQEPVSLVSWSDAGGERALVYAVVSNDWKIQYFGGYGTVNGQYNNDNTQVPPVGFRFDRYEEKDGIGYYWCNLTDNIVYDGTTLCFIESENEFDLQIEMPNGSYTYIDYFKKYPQQLEYMSGTWAGIQDDMLYKLELNEDGTLNISSPEIGVSGTWHIKPMRYDELNPDRLVIPMLFCYDSIGEWEHWPADLRLNPLSEEELDEFFAYGIHIHVDLLSVKLPIETDSMCSMQYVDEAALRAMEAAMEITPTERLCGRWEATKIQMAGSSEMQEDAGYAIEFREDRTFVQTGDADKTGTWSLVETTYNSYFEYIEYHFYIQYDEGEMGGWMFLNDKGELESHVDYPTFRYFEKAE